MYIYTYIHISYIYRAIHLCIYMYIWSRHVNTKRLHVSLLLSDGSMGGISRSSSSSKSSCRSPVTGWTIAELKRPGKSPCLMKKHRKTHRKTIGKWENHGKTIGTWENHRKTIGKWENRSKTRGKLYENHGKMEVYPLVI